MRSLAFLVSLFARRGVLAYAMVVMAAFEVSSLFQRGAPWRGDLLWTLDWVSVAFVGVGPVLAGAAALDTARWQAGAAHLGSRTTVRSPGLAVFAAYFASAVIVHALVLGSALLMSQPRDWDAWAPVAVLVQIAALGLCVAIGVFAGERTTPVLAGATAALVTLVAFYLFASPATGVSLLYTGVATVPRIGWSYAGPYLGLQMALLVAVTLGLLFSARAGRGLGLTIMAGTAALVLGAAMAGPEDRVVPSDVHPHYCGAVQTLETCFYDSHRRVAEDFQDVLWVIVEETRAAGYEALLPDRFEEASRTQIPSDPETGALYVQAEHLAGAAPNLDELLAGLTQPLHCPQLQEEVPPVDQYWADQNALVATWASIFDPAAPERYGYDGDLLSPEEAATLRDSFMRCTYPFTG